MKRTVVIAGTAVIALVAAGCSGDDVAENLVERAVEREAGEDVDIDFGGDGFSVETDEGSMIVDEDGNFVIIGPDGEEITGNVDDEGFSFEGDDGEVISGETDDDGSFTLETEDGTITSGSTTEIPDAWPSAVPQPEGFAIETASTFTANGEINLTVGGTSPDGPAWAEAYGAQLEAAGFENESTFTSNESSNASYTQGELVVNVSAFDMGDGSWQVAAVVFGPEG